MNLALLSVDTRVLLTTGDLAEIVAINADDVSVKVRYLDALAEPELVGTEAWLSADDVISIDMGTHSEGST